MIFSATSRPIAASNARCTTPLPPRPSEPVILYLPMVRSSGISEFRQVLGGVSPPRGMPNRQVIMPSSQWHVHTPRAATVHAHRLATDRALRAVLGGRLPTPT